MAKKAMGAKRPLKTFMVDGKPVKAKSAAEARAKRKPKAKKRGG
jgi:hypothetical protein